MFLLMFKCEFRVVQRIESYYNKIILMEESLATGLTENV